MSIEFISAPILSFGVVLLAEMGDKSQLVCMSLASRHNPKPVLIGAIAAFGLLNILAVTLGSNLSHLIPQHWLTIAAAVLFAFFGLQALFSKHHDEEVSDGKRSKTKSVFITTFLMIFVAELGDKTQLAIFTMSSTFDPIMIWFVGTLALATTSALGVLAGRKVLSRFDTVLIHRFSGIFYIALACSALFSLV